MSDMTDELDHHSILNNPPKDNTKVVFVHSEKYTGPAILLYAAVQLNRIYRTNEALVKVPLQQYNLWLPRYCVLNPDTGLCLDGHPPAWEEASQEES
jgi:hypothetical protein